MAYSDFSLKKVLQDFALSTHDAAFLPPMTSIEPSIYLINFLERSLPLAVALDNEKARSETVFATI
jgi:hypothetical protein